MEQSLNFVSPMVSFFGEFAAFILLHKATIEKAPRRLVEVPFLIP